MSSPFMFVDQGLTFTRYIADLVVIWFSNAVRLSPSFSM